jgi:hypothetical protein
MTTMDRDDDDLKKIIADLIERKYAAPEGCASWLACATAARRPAPIMEDLNPMEWGACAPIRRSHRSDLRPHKNSRESRSREVCR